MLESGSCYFVQKMKEEEITDLQEKKALAGYIQPLTTKLENDGYMEEELHHFFKAYNH